MGSSGRGNHFGCASEGSASTGVFGMMSSTVLAIQLLINIINASNSNNNNNNNNNNDNNLNDNMMVMVTAAAPMNMNIVVPGVGRKIRKIRSLFEDSVAPSGSCLPQAMRTLLSSCAERLLCPESGLSQLSQLYRQSLAVELFHTLGLSHQMDGRQSHQIICNKEVAQVCPA